MASSLSAARPIPVSLTVMRTRQPGCSRSASATSTSTCPRAGELDGVADQVGQHLADAARVAHQHVAARSAGSSPAVRALWLGPPAPGHWSSLRSSSQQVEGDGLQIELAGFDLGEIENVVDQREQALGAAVRHARQTRVAGRQFGLEQQLEHADHPVHRRADFVAHVGQEVALGEIRFVGHVLGAHCLVTLGLALAQRHDGGADGVADGGDLAVSRAVADTGVKVALGDPGQCMLKAEQGPQRVAHAPDDGRQADQQHQRQQRPESPARRQYTLSREGAKSIPISMKPTVSLVSSDRAAEVEQLAALHHLAHRRERLDRLADAQQTLHIVEGGCPLRSRPRAGASSGANFGASRLRYSDSTFRPLLVIDAHQANVGDTRRVGADSCSAHCSLATATPAHSGRRTLAAAGAPACRGCVRSGSWHRPPSTPA